MDIELMPCPFCGHIPEIHSENFLGTVYKRVKCLYCFAGTHWEDSVEEAAEEWNRRAE